MPWSATTSHLTWYNRILEAVAKVYKFSMNTPVKNLNDEVMKLVMYGTGDRKYTVNIGAGKSGHEEDDEGVGDAGGTGSSGSPISGFRGEYVTTFEGVIPNLERRYLETDSDYVRKKIESFMRILDCPGCHGKRLRPEVLAVKVGDISIIDATEFSVSRAKEFFGKLTLNDSEKHIAKMIFQEVNSVFSFLPMWVCLSDAQSCGQYPLRR